MEYALHETLEVHEIAAFKALCLTKSKTMRALVSDEELKQLMEMDAEMSTRQIEELKAIMSRASQ